MSLRDVPFCTDQNNVKLGLVTYLLYFVVTKNVFFSDGHPIMVTGSTIGHIALWNLEEKKLQSQIRNAHQSTVSGMNCLPSEPLMVTSAADNSLKVGYDFDMGCKVCSDL